MAEKISAPYPRKYPVKQLLEIADALEIRRKVSAEQQNYAPRTFCCHEQKAGAWFTRPFFVLRHILPDTDGESFLCIF